MTAAKRDIRVSRFVGDLLRTLLQQDADYQAATRRDLARKARRLRPRNAKYPSRDELPD
jgi:hypothetical protein